MPEDLRWNAATLWAGPKCHIVHYPLSGWKVFNLVVTYHNDAPEPVAGKPVSDEEVMQGFQHVHARAQDIIRHGRNWRLWVLCDRDPTERWVDGRVALLGDAAHPMMQYFAQGACMALEDAVCLSHMLAADPDDHAAALERYRIQRFAAPRGCNCNRAPSANTSTTRPANTPASATPSWGRRVRRTITAIWPGSMAAPGSGDEEVLSAVIPGRALLARARNPSHRDRCGPMDSGPAPRGASRNDGKMKGPTPSTAPGGRSCRCRSSAAPRRKRSRADICRATVLP